MMEYIAHIGSLDCYAFEKVNEVGNWHSVLENISSEIQQIKGHSYSLTIIDPYFLNIDDDVALEFANAFVYMLWKSSFRYVQVFSMPRYLRIRSKFMKTLQQNNKGIMFTFMKIPGDIHDRFWITNALTGVVVGTSFNGLGKQLSLVYRISNSDMEVLNNELLKREINCQPDLS